VIQKTVKASLVNKLDQNVGWRTDTLLFHCI